jgi:predicted unusual protein kinase regulating ubiquinone biosynthesis (AarF/ABC1/UbiB family)
MGTSAAAAKAAIDRQERRRQVEAALQAIGRPASVRRTPPPEGRLGPGEEQARRLRDLLAGLGPVFAAFGRYLASRVDLLPRRTRTELASIPDAGTARSFQTVASLIRRQLGAPIDRLFFEFHTTPYAVTAWSQRHLGWLSPGVPATVTVVHPEAVDWLDSDVLLLPLLAPWIGARENAVTAAIADFDLTIRRRLDQLHQAASLTALSDGFRTVAGFDAPACYRDHCAPNILTTERLVGETLDERADAGDARRLGSAWLRQALAGGVVPYDFGPRDVVAVEDRLVLTAASFVPHASTDRAHFTAYLGAVASDDPDTAANWILEGASAPPEVEVELRRQLRQTVPFRDGEWSGDDRLAEHVLVQWRVARDAGWPVSPHHQHLYRGLYAITEIANALAPDTDTLLAALEDERLRVGLSQAGRALDPRFAAETFERTILQLADLPQKLDDVLTLASEGRLRMKLQVPDSRETEHVRNRTVLLVTTLVAFAALASVVRQLVPIWGTGVERVGAVVLLVVGGWLLVAAARL